MKKEIIVKNDPKSPISEIFRTLRTNIQFMNSKGGLKTILITSTVQGEGKSLVSTNLATAFAQVGKRVILVDADMRKGRLHDIFNTQLVPGLSNYLSGVDETGRVERKDITNYILKTDIENLFLIPAGNPPPNPSELLISEVTIKMIDDLKKIADIIIFDGAPRLMLSDAIILSRLVDSTILVAKYNSTKTDNLINLKKDIENVGGVIAGVVMNKAPINAKKYESTYYYSSNVSTNRSNFERKPIREEYYSKDSNSEKEVKNKYLVENGNEVPTEKAQEILKQLDDYLKRSRRDK